MFWYLGDTLDNGKVVVACEDGCDAEHYEWEPNYKYDPKWPHSGAGLRPVLIMEDAISSTLLNGDIKLETNDIVFVEPWFDPFIPKWGAPRPITFTVIGDNLLLCDSYIGSDFTRQEYDVFGDTNIYEESEAKKKIDTWFDALKEQEYKWYAFKK